MTKKANKSFLLFPILENLATSGSLIFQSQIGRLEKLRAQKLSSSKIQRRMTHAAK